jgi:hypothetical protein
MNSEKNYNQSQEIDLLDLFNRIGKGIKNLFLSLFRGILFIVVFAIRKFHFLILFGVAGGLIGLLFYSSTQRYYSSNLVVQPNGITSTDMINYINDLHDLCLKKNTPGLAYGLEMKDTTAAKIKNIQAFFVIDLNHDGVGDYVDFKNNIDLKDTTQHRLEDRIYVTVEVFDNRVFENVKNGLFRYMRKNPYIIKLNEIRKNELKESIAQIDFEISKLDSLQDVEYFEDRGRIPVKESQMMFLSEKEQHMYYKDKLALLLKKQEYGKELDLATDAFTVIKDFTNLAVAENPRGKYIIRYSLLFLIIGYIIILGYRFKAILLDAYSREK